MTEQKPGLKARSKKASFIKDAHFKGYTKPNMVNVANDMLCTENLSEEGFLGAQAVLLLNGVL